MLLVQRTLIVTTATGTVTMAATIATMATAPPWKPGSALRLAATVNTVHLPHIPTQAAVHRDEKSWFHKPSAGFEPQPSWSALHFRTLTAGKSLIQFSCFFLITSQAHNT